MKNPLNFDFQRLNPRNRQPGSNLVGLAFDNSRLQVVEVRRTNGSVEIKKTFSTSLSLDLLTNAPELVGREIRKILDEHGIRERWCIVALPLHWALTLNVKMPDLPEADLASFLQVEAERGFPYGPEALLTATSRYTTAKGEPWATLIAVPRTHVTRLEEVLAAAQLRPASFSLGIAAMQPADAADADGVLTLAPGEENIRMQLSIGKGIAVLRTIEGAFDLEGAGRQLQADHVLREMRITLGQLDPQLRDAVRSVRVLGDSEDAKELAEVLQSKLQAQGLVMEHVRVCRPNDFPVKLPINTPMSPALALTVRRLAGTRTTLEFLPPKITAWQRFSSKYSSPKLVTASACAGAVVAIVLLAFLVQQIQLWYWGHRWNSIQEQVAVLKKSQENINKYRAWYDPTFRELSILRQLTEAFPDNGTASAKQIEIRDPNKPGELPLITCTGTAIDNSTFLRVQDALGKKPNVRNVQTKDMRGTSPIEFSFNFQWSGGNQ